MHHIWFIQCSEENYLKLLCSVNGTPMSLMVLWIRVYRAITCFIWIWCSAGTSGSCQLHTAEMQSCTECKPHDFNRKGHVYSCALWGQTMVAMSVCSTCSKLELHGGLDGTMWQQLWLAQLGCFCFHLMPVEVVGSEDNMKKTEESLGYLPFFSARNI